ncbi:MAG TPA: hypothetical protein PK874_01220, partial [Desulfobacteraceae bacterium]|nr:hypothetical protein [Desulfobacteraceae bacterium]
LPYITPYFLKVLSHNCDRGFLTKAYSSVKAKSPLGFYCLKLDNPLTLISIMKQTTNIKKTGKAF